MFLFKQMITLIH